MEKSVQRLLIIVTKNGYNITLTDNATQNQLFRTVNVNERGQFKLGYFGNGGVLKMDYDQYGYLTNNQADKVVDQTTVVNGVVVLNTTTTNIMTLSNQFEPARGNLMSRTTNLFGVNELFEYDNLNRLKKWTSPPTGLLNLDFSTNNTQGFTVVNGGTVSVFLGKLVIGSKLSQAGAQKLIASNAYAGNKFNIQVKVTKNTTNKIRIVAVEENITNGAFTYTVLGLANEGLFQSDYQIQNPNVKFYLRFDKSENSTDVGVAKTFYLDDLIVTKYAVETQTYDDRGKITENSLGQYQYTNSIKPYQNTSVTTTPEANAYYQAKSLQEITYTAFKAPIEIVEPNIDRITFGYNNDEERSIMYYGSTATDKTTRPYRKYYSADGSMEIKAVFSPGSSTPTAVEFLTYIGGDAYSAPVVWKNDGVTIQNYFYLHRDYQGSIVAISDSNLNIVEKRLFDPWGGIVKVQDGTGANLTKLTFFERGYTGHEHLQSVGLINMNARLYDPKLHRFLSPDNYIQDPYNTQNYNRYGYCVNNPLKYTDISGNVFTIATVAGGIPFVGSILSSLLMHQNINFNQVATDVMFTTASILVTYGIGSACSTIANFWTQAAVSAAAHGVFNGAMYDMQGGKFWQGFAAGAVSSIAASLWQGGSSFDNSGNAIANSGMKGFGETFGMNNGFGTIAFGSIMGGAGSALAGGNFWNGAVTGMIVSGFNHVRHVIEQQQIKKSFEDGLRNVLKTAKIGLEISSDDLVENYGVPKKAANLIKSFTKTSANTIEVDWSSGFSMGMAKNLSSAVFNDGTIKIDFLKNGSLRLTGNAIGIENGKKIYYNLTLEGDYARIPSIKGFRWKIGL